MPVCISLCRMCVPTLDVTLHVNNKELKQQDLREPQLQATLHRSHAICSRVRCALVGRINRCRRAQITLIHLKEARGKLKKKKNVNGALNECAPTFIHVLKVHERQMRRFSN